jgi:hypothetical protein
MTRLGNDRNNFGRRIPVEILPADKVLTFNDFKGGYNSSTSRQTAELDSSPFSEDIEVNRKNYLVRAPGTSLFQDREGHDITQMMVHANLENRAELLLFSPPFLGIKQAGFVEWIDFGLDGSKPYVATNFAGTLIFSNSVGRPWVRQPESSVIERGLTIPSAVSYATFASRVFAFGTEIEGTLEPMGVRWSAANSNYEDWTGIGAGDELLIDEMVAGDRCIAARTLGFDFMAVINRNSVWIARRTGMPRRPADFQPRVPGVGAINEAVCRTSRFGVTFLHDTGVYIFDGNSATMVSAEINADLLPLDYTQLNRYSAVYNPLNKRYYLHTPTETWIWDIEYKRWFRRSLVARQSALFAEQFSATTWAEATGTWDEKTEVWADFSPQQGNEMLLFLGESVHQEDNESLIMLDQAINSRWDFPAGDAATMVDLLTVKGVIIRYVGGGTVEFYTNDHSGDLISSLSIDLIGSAEPRVARISGIITGLGAGLGLRIVSGDVEVISVQAVVLGRSQRIEEIL